MLPEVSQREPELLCLTTASIQAQDGRPQAVLCTQGKCTDFTVWKWLCHREMQMPPPLLQSHGEPPTIYHLMPSMLSGSHALGPSCLSSRSEAGWYPWVRHPRGGPRCSPFRKPLQLSSPETTRGWFSRAQRTHSWSAILPGLWSKDI